MLLVRPDAEVGPLWVPLALGESRETARPARAQAPAGP